MLGTVLTSLVSSDTVNDQTAALRTIRFAIGLHETKRDEHVLGFFLGHASDLLDAKRPRPCQERKISRLNLRYSEFASDLMNKSGTVNPLFIIYDVISVIWGDLTMDWNAQAKALLRAEMIRRRIRSADLAVMLADIGIEENERNLGNKIARGTFSAAFLLQCLAAMKVTNLNLGEG